MANYDARKGIWPGTPTLSRPQFLIAKLKIRTAAKPLFFNDFHFSNREKTRFRDARFLFASSSPIHPLPEPVR